MLCGLLKPTSGRATVAGIDVSRDPDGVKRRIGYMSQRFSLYELLTVDENIAFYGGLYGLSGEAMQRRRRFALEIGGLTGRERDLTRDLSGGWRQRLALGCALLHEPPIVFLDEPTGGVDPVSRREFWRLIDDVSQTGTTVLVTTHYLDEAERCDRVAIMHAGRLAALGTPTELKTAFRDRPIVEVRSPSPVAVMTWLDSWAEVEKTSLFGTAVHAVLRKAGTSPAMVESALAAAGQPVTSVSLVVPSLEDVFLDVVDRVEAGSAA
jgi:ABC-2 type transport system ATP-binding protein